MAFLRFSRDKRGYEHFFLVETTIGRRGKSRARVLYWFRTPPGIKVGREPFDPEIRRALESKNPGVAFDWERILSTPIPSVETEKWRERRRAEKERRGSRMPSRSIEGGEPVESSEPIEAGDAVEPNEPLETLESVEPVSEPFEPLEPLEPLEPGE